MTTLDLANTWEKVLIELKKTVTNSSYSTWISSVMPLSMGNNCFEIGVPKQFIKDWIECTYALQMQSILTNICGNTIELKITNLESTEELQPTSTQNIIPQATINSPTLQEVVPPSIDTVSVRTSYDLNLIPSVNNSLNSKYIFENFVVGNSNRMAQAAALAVTNSPGGKFNPLFLYGAPGLGKTHLMHAIGNKLIANFTHMRVLYVTSETFTNDLVNAIKDGDTEIFRTKYRNIDCLLVDDIQFLTKKERTQEEFFHTFNTLHEANKHVILSSDKQPKEIPELEERLRSRFEWGLIADIQVPDLETRIAILKKKAFSENMEIPNDILMLIASRIHNNIRELEGALIRVMAFCSINNLTLSIDNAKIALKEIFPEGRAKPVTIEKIQQLIMNHYKISSEDLLSKTRARNIAYPRQIAMYLCRELTNATLPLVGDSFGGRDHTTVMHACDKIASERSSNPKIDAFIRDLINMVQK